MSHVIALWADIFIAYIALNENCSSEYPQSLFAIQTVIVAVKRIN